MSHSLEICPPCEHVSIIYDHGLDTIFIYQGDTHVLTVATDTVDSIGDVELMGWSHAKTVAGCGCKWHL